MATSSVSCVSSVHSVVRLKLPVPRSQTVTASTANREEDHDQHPEGEPNEYLDGCPDPLLLPLPECPQRVLSLPLSVPWCRASGGTPGRVHAARADDAARLLIGYRRPPAIRAGVVTADTRASAPR
jgi:hypothetical protein